MTSIKKRNQKIGFMQGRFSPVIEGKIQAFPWLHWRNEFELAEIHGFGLMEWTLDQDRLYENPLMTEAGRAEIKYLKQKHKIAIPSLTGDCFMQEPFYKTFGEKQKQLLEDLKNIIDSCALLRIKIILIPLVDNGRIENREQMNCLIQNLSGIAHELKKNGVTISFESDFQVESLSRFINDFGTEDFGITYDIGNSAALGFNFEKEIQAYGNKINNVHVKDRMLGGASVPLGTGNADLPNVLHALQNNGYMGNYILQTARAEDDNHINVLCQYRDLVELWLNEKSG